MTPIWLLCIANTFTTKTINDAMHRLLLVPTLAFTESVGLILIISSISMQWGISMVLGDVVNLDVWCWDLLNKLRLHGQDQPTPILRASGHTDETSGGHSSKAGEAMGVRQHGGGTSSGRNFSAPDLNSDPMLYPVNKALANKIPLACYIAVAMTKAGHK